MSNDSTNPIVRNALKACNADPLGVATNTDEYVIRKSLSTSKWFLSKKAKSLSGGEDKIFSTEQEARDYAKKNGLMVVNSDVATNGAGYSNYANARTDFIKKMDAARVAAMEMASAISGFEKDPLFNKEYEKMVRSDSAFVGEFMKTVGKFKV